MIEGYADPEVKYDITYLSLGAGVQSTALLAMSCDDDRVPTADLAIFADTQCEPDYVYKNIERLKTLSNIPIHVVTAGSLTEDAIDRHNGQRSRFAAMPVWTLGADNRSAPLRRGAAKAGCAERPRGCPSHTFRILIHRLVTPIANERTRRDPW